MITITPELVEWAYQSVSVEVPNYGPNYESLVSAKIVDMIAEGGKLLVKDGYAINPEPIQILINLVRNAFLITVVMRGRKA